MAKIKTTRVWNGLPIDEYTDTETGVVELYSQPTRGAMGSSTPGTLFATGDDKGKWSYNDQAAFRRGYNNKQRTQGKPTLTQEDFNKKFFTEGTKIVNNDRAAVLNNIENYTGVSQAVRNKVSFSENGIPGVINPETGEKNNSQGNSVEDPDKNQGEEEDSDSFELKPIAEKPIGSVPGQNLRYPLGQIPDLGYDFVTFTAHEYKAGGLENLTTSTGTERVGNALETISLPMLPGREESNSVTFGSDSMNMIQQAAGNIALKTLNVTSGEGMVAGLGAFASQSKEELDNLLKADSAIRTQIIAYFAGQAAQAPGLLTRSTGSVLNPNMELLFKGPNLRTFNFAFQFRPRFEDESVAVKEIIRIFKRNMAVQRSASEFFLLTPNIFTIKYIHNSGEDHPFMNRMKPCMLSGFNVNYTPDNSYMTYQDGGMTGYDVTMTFQEIVPIYADEQQNEGGTGF
jgi:hypothetical protein